MLEFHGAHVGSFSALIMALQVSYHRQQGAQRSPRVPLGSPKGAIGILASPQPSLALAPVGGRDRRFCRSYNTPLCNRVTMAIVFVS